MTRELILGVAALLLAGCSTLAQETYIAAELHVAEVSPVWAEGRNKYDRKSPMPLGGLEFGVQHDWRSTSLACAYRHVSSITVQDQGDDTVLCRAIWRPFKAASPVTPTRQRQWTDVEAAAYNKEDR